MGPGGGAASRDLAHKLQIPAWIDQIGVLTDAAPGHIHIGGVRNVKVPLRGGNAVKADGLGQLKLLYIFCEGLAAQLQGDLGKGAVAGAFLRVMVPWTPSQVTLSAPMSMVPPQ